MGWGWIGDGSGLGCYFVPSRYLFGSVFSLRCNVGLNYCMESFVKGRSKKKVERTFLLFNFCLFSLVKNKLSVYTNNFKIPKATHAILRYTNAKLSLD